MCAWVIARHVRGAACLKALVKSEVASRTVDAILVEAPMSSILPALSDRTAMNLSRAGKPVLPPAPFKQWPEQDVPEH